MNKENCGDQLDIDEDNQRMLVMTNTPQQTKKIMMDVCQRDTGGKLKSDNTTSGKECSPWQIYQMSPGVKLTQSASTCGKDGLMTTEERINTRSRTKRFVRQTPSTIRKSPLELSSQLTIDEDLQ